MKTSHRLVFTALALLALSPAASASIVYQMTTGICTDSNHSFLSYPVAGGPDVFGAGPKVCADTVTMVVNMRDSYVPGTSFFDSGFPGQPTPVMESFFFSDGARSLHLLHIVAAESSGGLRRVSGQLPVAFGTGALEIYWVEGGWFTASFDSNGQGTWNHSSEFDARRDICGIGSVAGPVNVPPARCIDTIHYASTGTFTGFSLVAEPAPLVLLFAASLGWLIATRKTHTVQLH